MGLLKSPEKGPFPPQKQVLANLPLGVSANYTDENEPVHDIAKYTLNWNSLYNLPHSPHPSTPVALANALLSIFLLL